MNGSGKRKTPGKVGELQRKVQVKWDLVAKYLHKANSTSSVPQRMQATFRAKAYVHQVLQLIHRLPQELQTAARAGDPRN